MEISAQELRIGNYINGSIGDDSELVLCYVTGYDPRDEFIFVSNDNNIHYAEFVDFQPIPLTEEWLLKFGFIISYESEFRKKLDFKENTQFGYDFNKTGKKNGMHGFRYYGRYHKCEFVHQIQNLYFALTGEELTI